MARLDSLAPGELANAQRALHPETEPMIAEHLQGFVPVPGAGDGS